MDKYEYRISLQEINQLISEQRFDEAAGIADTIDWSRVKNPATLCKISDVYKINKEYAKARRVLMLANEKDPENAEIIYSLCELTIFLYGRDGLQSDLISAHQLKSNYQAAQPGTAKGLILEYKFYKVTNVSAPERAALLEQLKGIQYSARWGYELALCYHEAGDDERAIAECRSVLSSFGGKYAGKAEQLLHSIEGGAVGTAAATPAAANAGSAENSSAARPASADVEADHHIDTAAAVSADLDNSAKIEAATRAALASERPIVDPALLNDTAETAQGAAAAETLDVPEIHSNAAATEAAYETAQDATVHYTAPTGMREHAESAAASAADVATASAAVASEVASAVSTPVVAVANETEAITAEAETKEPSTSGNPAAQAAQAGAGDKVAQENNGQYVMVEDQIPGKAVSSSESQMSIGQVMTEWEKIKHSVRSQNDKRREQKILEDTGELLHEFDETAKHSMLEDIERNVERQQRVARQGYAYSELSDGLTDEERRRAQQAGYYEAPQGNETGYAPLDEDYDNAAQAEAEEAAPEEVAAEMNAPAAHRVFTRDGQSVQTEYADAAAESGAEAYTDDTAEEAEYANGAAGETAYAEEDADESYGDESSEGSYDENADDDTYEEAPVEAACGAGAAEGYDEEQAESEGDQAVTAAYDEERTEFSGAAAYEEEEADQGEQFNTAPQSYREPSYQETLYEESGADDAAANTPLPAEHVIPESFVSDNTDTTADESEQPEADDYSYLERGEDHTTRRWNAAAVRRAMEAEKARLAALEAADRARLEHAVEHAGEEVAEEPVKTQEIPAAAPTAATQAAAMTATVEEEATKEPTTAAAAEEEATQEPVTAEGTARNVAPAGATSRTANEAAHVKRVTLADVLGSADDEAEEFPEETEEANVAEESATGAETETAGGPDVHTEEPMQDEAEEAAETFTEEPAEAEEAAHAEEPIEEEAEASEELVEEEENAGEGKAHHSKKGAAHGERKLSEEEKKLCGSSASIKANSEQIATALDGISLAGNTGNVIITGDQKSALDVAAGILEITKRSDPNFSGKVAKANVKQLNKLSPSRIRDLLDKINNGALQINGASSLARPVVETIYHELEDRERGLIVLMLDGTKAMNAFAARNRKFLGSFTVRIDIKAMTDKDLVAYGIEYALSKDYSIDEVARMALSTRIASMQTIDHPVMPKDVRDLVDEAIYYASKKSLGTLVEVITRKRYDADDRIIIHEKDFMHY